MKKSNKIKNTTSILTPKKVFIDGFWVDDAELAEFLDWHLVSKSSDFKAFKALKDTGYFVINPITPEMLTEAVENAAHARCRNHR